LGGWTLAMALVFAQTISEVGPDEKEVANYDPWFASATEPMITGPKCMEMQDADDRNELDMIAAMPGGLDGSRRRQSTDSRVRLLTQRRKQAIAVIIAMFSVRHRRARRGRYESEDSYHGTRGKRTLHGAGPLTLDEAAGVFPAAADADGLPTAYFGIKGQFESPASIFAGRS
jgi:hypothetical protein